MPARSAPSAKILTFSSAAPMGRQSTEATCRAGESPAEHICHAGVQIPTEQGLEARWWAPGAGRPPARLVLDEHAAHTGGDGRRDVDPTVADEPRGGEVEVEVVRGLPEQTG